MRPSFAVAFLSALLITVSVTFAQRGGHAAGHAAGSVGGHSFSGGGFAGGSFGRSSGFASRSFAPAPRFTSTAPTRAFVPGYRTPYTGPFADRRNGRGDRYRPAYRGYGAYPYAYANSWELLPWDIGYPDFTGAAEDDGDPGPDVAQQPSPYVAAPDDGTRPDYEAPPYPDYAPPPPQDLQPAADAVTPEPQLTLIFNDGHREEIRNYVLTSSDVIVLDHASAGRQERIPLAALNLPATEEAAQQAGLDFSPPA